MNAAVEGVIKQVLGRYLLNFEEKNVYVSLLGSVELSDVEINLEEIRALKFPFEPSAVFIGKLKVSLPLLISTEFKVTASDVLIVLEDAVEKYEDMDADDAQKALQTLIAGFYLMMNNEFLKYNYTGVVDPGSNSSLEVDGGISALQLEYTLRLVDRLAVKVENVHFRIEDRCFTSHLTHLHNGDSNSNRNRNRNINGNRNRDAKKEREKEEKRKRMVFGALIGCLELFWFDPASSLENKDGWDIVPVSLSGKGKGEQNSFPKEWEPSTKDSIDVNKRVSVDSLRLYCRREPSIFLPLVRNAQMEWKKEMEKGKGDNEIDYDYDEEEDEDEDGDSGCESDASTDDGKDKDKDKDSASRNSNLEGWMNRITITSDFVREQYDIQRAQTTEGVILLECGIRLSLSIRFQRDLRLFSPVSLHLGIHDLHLSLDDEQIAFLLHLGTACTHYLPSLQRRCLRGSCHLMRPQNNTNSPESRNSSGSSGSSGNSKKEDIRFRKRRAQLRWRMLRSVVLQDWAAYSFLIARPNGGPTFDLRSLLDPYGALSFLQSPHMAVGAKLGLRCSGGMRWRSWYNEWRLAARYVAVREILLYHVGYEYIVLERSTGADEDGVEKWEQWEQMQMHETLLADHNQGDESDQDQDQDHEEGFEDVREPAVGSKEEKDKDKAKEKEKEEDKGYIYYRGIGMMKESILSAAEVMVQQKIRGQGKGVSPLSLSLRAVRSLYALQLEMDSLLTPHKAAMLRVWADNRYREARAHKKAQEAITLSQAKAEAEAEAEGEAENTRNKSYESDAVNSANKANKGMKSASDYDADSGDEEEEEEGGEDDGGKQEVAGTHGSAMGASISEGLRTRNNHKSLRSAVLLIGVADAVGLSSGGLGMSRIEASCSLVATAKGSIIGSNGSNGSQRSQGRQSVSTTCLKTDPRVAKVPSAGNGGALCGWAQSVVVDVSHALSAIESSESESMEGGKALVDGVEVELSCGCLSMFQPDYGTRIVKGRALLGEKVDTSRAAAVFFGAGPRLGLVQGQGQGQGDLNELEPTVYEGAVHTLYVPLDPATRASRASTNNSSSADGALGSSVLTLPSEVATSTAADDRPCVRLLTQLVFLSSHNDHPKAHSKRMAILAQRTIRFNGLLEEAVTERKAVWQAQLQRSEADVAEDEDENFVLDPSVLTFQSVTVTATVPAMSLTTGMAVVIPHSQLSEIAGGVKVEFVPILRYECHSLWISALASNNPWDVDVRGGCGSVSVHMSGDSGPSSASNDDDNCTTGLLVPVFCSPCPITFSASAIQTSTVGRNLYGWGSEGSSPLLLSLILDSLGLSGVGPVGSIPGIDESCFEWRGSMTCGPFTAALDPQSSNGPERRTKEGESGSSVCLWDGSRFRLLSHLFRSEASQMWARGTAQGQQPYHDTLTADRLEAKMRLGDQYSPFPLHRNVLQEMSAMSERVDVNDDNDDNNDNDDLNIIGSSNSSNSGNSDGASGGPFPFKQRTTIKFSTPARSLCVGISATAPTHTTNTTHAQGAQGRSWTIAGENSKGKGSDRDRDSSYDDNGQGALRPGPSSAQRGMAERARLGLEVNKEETESDKTGGEGGGGSMLWNVVTLGGIIGGGGGGGGGSDEKMEQDEKEELRRLRERVRELEAQLKEKT